MFRVVIENGRAGMMMGNPTMGMNPSMATTSNPYMFLSTTGMQPAPQQQQHPTTLSTNLWQ